MAKNKLYSFIGYGLQKNTFKNAGLDAKRFESKSTQENKAYYLYSLPHGQQIKVTSQKGHEFTLTGHHISVYEKQDASNAFLSPYHYTAYFSNVKDHSRFQLHVYFNEKDQLTSQPIFSQVTRKGSLIETYQKDDELREQFKQLALQQTSSLIKELRMQQNSIVTKLVQQYQEQESVLVELSRDVKANKQDYLKQLKAMLPGLDVLTGLSDTGQYKGIIQFLKRIELKVKQEVTKVNANTSERLAKNDSKTNVGSSDVVEEKIEKIIKENHFDTKYNELSRLVGMYQESDSKENSVLQRISVGIDDLLSLSLDDQYNVSLKVLQHILNIQASFRTDVEKKIKMLLLSSKFEEADEFGVAVHGVANRLYKIAIFAGKDELVDYILSRTTIEVDTFTVSDQLNALEYIANVMVDKEPEKAKRCFDVLLKHDANILMPNQHGIPLAHQIMSVPQHPLVGIIVSHYTNNELLNVYKKLINALKHMKVVDMPEGNVQERMAEALDYYHLNCQSLTHAAGSGHSKASNKMLSAMQESASRLIGFETQSLVLADPLVKEKMKILNELKVKLLSRMDKRQKMLYERDNRMGLQNALKIVEIVGVHRDKLVQQTCNSLDLQIETIHHNLEIIALSKSLPKQYVPGTKLHRYWLATTARINELYKKIQENTELCGFSESTVDALQSLKECGVDFAAVSQIQDSSKQEEESEDLKNLDFEAVADEDEEITSSSAELTSDVLNSFISDLSALQRKFSMFNIAVEKTKPTEEKEEKSPRNKK